ncbi:uncharacterized protein VICG_01812, partial [Vittaforma corneae ATCC 50505]
MNIVRTKKAYKAICCLIAFVGATHLNTTNGVNPDLSGIQSPDSVGYEACTSQKCRVDIDYGYPLLKDITSLHDVIEELKYLCCLDLSRKELRSLPAVIEELKNLRKLDLSGNKFEVLPSNIVKLENLEILYLNGNKLETLP